MGCVLLMNSGEQLKDVVRCWKCQQTIYSKPGVSLPVPCPPSSSQSAFETQIQHHLLQELGFLLTLITSGHLQTLSSTVLALELKQSPKICDGLHQKTSNPLVFEKGGIIGSWFKGATFEWRRHKNCNELKSSSHQAKGLGSSKLRCSEGSSLNAAELYSSIHCSATENGPMLFQAQWPSKMERHRQVHKPTAKCFRAKSLLEYIVGSLWKVRKQAKTSETLFAWFGYIMIYLDKLDASEDSEDVIVGGTHSCGTSQSHPKQQLGGNLLKSKLRYLTWY